LWTEPPVRHGVARPPRAIARCRSSKEVATWKPGPVGAACNTPTNPDKAVVSDKSRHKTDRLPAIFPVNSPSHNGTLRQSLSGCRFLRTPRQCHTTYKGQPPDGNTAQSTVSTPFQRCRSGVKRTKTKSRFQTRRRGGDLRLPIFRQTRDMSSPQQRSVTCTSWTFVSCSSAASRRSTLSSLDLISLTERRQIIKYIDQQNINFAYTAGMQQDLNLYGNELNLFTTYFNVGCRSSPRSWPSSRRSADSFADCIFIIPSQIMITWFRPALYLSSLELIWGVLTFCYAATHNASQVYAIRALVGIAESSAYPGAITLLSEWAEADSSLI
jgi:hypothetical protein